MTEAKRPAQTDGENASERELAPEAHNAEQDDEGAQAQSVADEAIGRTTTTFGNEGETERVSSTGLGDEPDSTPDLVDNMNQMLSSGRIDMSAFRGERSDDDEEGLYGESGIEDETPRGAP